MLLETLDIRKDKINQFAKKGLHTVQDLVDYIPRKYIDFTKTSYVKNLIDGEYSAIEGVIVEVKEVNGSCVIFKVQDDLNNKMSVSFFHKNFITKKFKKGDRVIAGGKVKVNKDYYNAKSISNPLIFSKEINKNKKILPIYSSINGMSEEFLKKTLLSALNRIDLDDYLENELLAKYKLAPKHKSVNKIHNPLSLKELEEANKRLLIDDLFHFYYDLYANSSKNVSKSDIKISKFKKAKELMDNLPFELTEGQREVLRNISRKMMKGDKVKGLIQGDVGTGKTLVALLLMVTVSENGYQSCLVAPTNILAKQHYLEAKNYLEPLGFKLGFLSSDLKKKEIKEILSKLKTGEIDMVIGTHSLMGVNVEFKNLGLSIIDEEHRFGVIQREQLNKDGIHTVSMTATPIPRSLALSIYGEEVQVETIKSAPRGRKEIETNIISIEDKESVYESVKAQIKEGKQAYIVCPLIDKSSSEKMEGVISVEEEYAMCKKYFKGTSIKIGIINGKMKEPEIEEEILKFKNKEYDVIISTTIIEVGVNVPNATIIIINNAERFGFAQLHQLRGRVGRGVDQSYCYLITNNKDKFNIFVETKNGFEIAKADLRLRGSGDFLGTTQSGANKYLMLILANEELANNLKVDVKEIIKDDKRKSRYDLYFKKNYNI